MSDKTDDVQFPIGYILVTNGNPNEVGIPGTWVKIRKTRRSARCMPPIVATGGIITDG